MKQEKGCQQNNPQEVGIGLDGGRAGLSHQTEALRQVAGVGE